MGWAESPGFSRGEEVNSKIREVLESSGYAYTPDNIAAVRANIPLHTSDLILAALNATDLPDKRFALPLF